MIKNHFVLFILLIFSQSIFAGEAKEMEKILIPGAKCGNGEPYSVFLLKKDPEAMVVTFQSGGACWSKSTCYGPNLRAIIKPKKKGKIPKIISKTDSFNNHTQLYLPYCTGDTFSGSHIGDYSKKVYHYGALNVEKAIAHLNKTGKISFARVNDLVLFGGSAGGIGALIHSKNFEEVVHQESKKTLIIDSPGLHFGHNFWNRFSEKTLESYRRVFKRINFNAPLTDGFVAPYLAESCDFLSGWNIGFIMGSMDMVMSRIFGRISMKDHKSLVYSQDGIVETLKKTNNCSLWLKKSRIHTFLQGFPTWKKKASGVRAIDFATSVYHKHEQEFVIEGP